jgi:hypothetical protein
MTTELTICMNRKCLNNYPVGTCNLQRVHVDEEGRCLDYQIIREILEKKE